MPQYSVEGKQAVNVIVTAETEAEAIKLVKNGEGEIEQGYYEVTFAEVPSIANLDE